MFNSGNLNGLQNGHAKQVIFEHVHESTERDFYKINSDMLQMLLINTSVY